MTIPYTENTAWADNAGGGTPITATKLNNIEQGITDAHLMPAVRVFNSANIAISSGVETTVTFDSERFDRAGGASATHHSTSVNTGRLTCLYAGIYFIHAEIAWSTNANGPNVEIRLNGSTKIASAPSVIGSDVRRQSVSTLYSLSVNDFVEVRVTPNAAASVLNLNQESPEFMMVRVA